MASIRRHRSLPPPAHYRRSRTRGSLAYLANRRRATVIDDNAPSTSTQFGHVGQDFGVATGTWVQAYRDFMTINIASDDWVPDSCTLPTAQQPLRVAEFDRFFAESVHRPNRTERTRLDLLIAADAIPVGQDLAQRETGCCSFFTFGFDTDDSGAMMHIEVPAAHVDVLDALEARVVSAIGRRGSR
jgi:hypothetical protein